MKVACIGGGPAGLYLSLLLKKARPDSDVTIFERNPAGATYGWGVVFSDRTLTSFREADYKTYQQIIDNFIIWDSIDVCYRDEVVRCGGQVFSGISRKYLLGLLEARAVELGVRFEHEREVADVAEFADHDLVVGADGVRSTVREAYVEAFRPRFVSGKSRYIWFGTTRSFDSFTFILRSNKDGFFQVHAYPYDGTASTFIVECDADTWQHAGLDFADERASIDYCEELFAPELRGHKLMSNNSKWIGFETLRCRSWHHDNVVLVGDAAHTAHFSIGSGTKLAMEDSIALANALEEKSTVGAALVEYELERKPRVERFQEAARQSQTYFENTRRYQHMEPLQFAFHLLSRSGRIDYDDLRLRDRHFVGAVDRWFVDRSNVEARLAIATPPAFAPLDLRKLVIPNRVAVVGESDSGAGLVFTDTVAVSEQGRATPADSGIYSADQASAWKKAIAEARERSGAAFAITLGHAGPRGATKDRTLTVDIPLDEGWPILAASPAAYGTRNSVPVEMDRTSMDEVRNAFVAAARRAREAGFDLVELHMGHGYLLASFISPLTNLRNDEYGGSLENRLRFPLEVLTAVREEWPDDLPVGVAMNAHDWTPKGTGLEDAAAAALAFKEAGADMIRVLAGQTTSKYRPRYDPYYLTHYADHLRNETGMATIATGDISTVDHINTIVAAGRADLCTLRISV